MIITNQGPVILSQGLMVVTGSESPIVVVLSGSMEPAFHRGDLLFLTNHREEAIRVGEIVVFKVEGREIPIVHRVIKVSVRHRRMARGGRGLPKVSLWPVVPDPFTPYGRATPEWSYGWSPCRAGSRVIPLWLPNAVRL
jgi:signal peptidase I